MVQRAEIRGTHLEYRWIGPPASAAPTIVFLHEGLGSVSMWRDFPDRLAAATSCSALVYSRRGYGLSDPVRAPRPIRFMHDEAETLPAVIEHFEIETPILYGHSDGASIAIIYAASHSVRALVLEAPHVFVEPVCIESIRRIATSYASTSLRDRLAKHHGENTESMFRSWSGVWLHPEFPQWNIEEYLPSVKAPALVIQGEDDEYGTLKQVEAVLTQSGGPAESFVLSDCGHSPHSQRPDEVLAAATRFIRTFVPEAGVVRRPDRSSHPRH